MKAVVGIERAEDGRGRIRSGATLSSQRQESAEIPLRQCMLVLGCLEFMQQM